MALIQFKYKRKNYIYERHHDYSSNGAEFCLYSKSDLKPIFSCKIVYGSLCSVKIIQNITYHSGTYINSDIKKFRTKHKDLVKEFLKHSLNLDGIESTGNKLYITFQNITKNLGVHLRDELGFIEMSRLPATYTSDEKSNKLENVNNCMSILAIPGNKDLTKACARTLEILANGENLK